LSVFKSQTEQWEPKYNGVKRGPVRLVSTPRGIRHLPHQGFSASAREAERMVEEYSDNVLHNNR